MPTPIINQGAFTAVVEIKRSRLEDLRKLLSLIGITADTNNCPLDFRKLKTVHFMRWVILEATDTKNGDSRYNTPPYLVTMTSRSRIISTI